MYILVQVVCVTKVCVIFAAGCFYRAMHFSAKRGIAIAFRLSVRLSVFLSVTLVDHDHIGWKYWKLITWTISPTTSLFVAHRASVYSQGNMGKFGGH